MNFPFAGLYFAYLLFLLGLSVFGIVIVFMFYARLRDIAEELKRFRIAYQHAQDRAYEIPSPYRKEFTPSNAPGPQTTLSQDAKYMPKA